MSTDIEKFGARIRTLRIEKGWSQEELASNAGLDRSYVGGIERGERNVSLKNICLLAKTLGVSVKSLFDWEGNH